MLMFLWSSYMNIESTAICNDNQVKNFNNQLIEFLFYTQTQRNLKRYMLMINSIWLHHQIC